MALANWIIGPQSVGVLFFLIGIVKHYFPSKKVNSIYGFRTPSSPNNKQTWDVANRYAAVYCIKFGIIAIVAGILISALLNNLSMAHKTKQMLHTILFIGSGVFIGPLLIVATEKHLDKTFKE